MATLNDYRRACRDLLEEAPPEVVQLLQRIKAEELYPELLRKVLRALTALVARNEIFYVTQGERTWEQQHALYLRGRGVGPPGRYVTKVDAGNSAHNYAVAADGVRDHDLVASGLQPSWASNHLKPWADAAREQGLDAGFYWPTFYDGPHVQLNLRKHGLTPRRHLKRAYLRGGKLAVFELLGKFRF